MADLSSDNRHHMASKAENIYCLAFCRRSLPVLALNVVLVVQSATTETPQAEYLFLLILEAAKSKIKAPADLASLGGLFPGSQTAWLSSGCVLTW